MRVLALQLLQYGVDVCGREKQPLTAPVRCLLGQLSPRQHAHLPAS